MRRFTVVSAAAALLLVATSAFASYGGGAAAKKDRPSTSASGAAANTPRAEAERLYAQAYDEVARARKDLADGKANTLGRAMVEALAAAAHDLAREPRGGGVVLTGAGRAFSAGLDAVATWCFDSGGAWSAGTLQTGKMKKPVAPDAPPIGDCAKAIASC